MDCFFIGRLSGAKGAVWQYTAIDVASAYCWAELHLTPRNPSARWTSELGRRGGGRGSGLLKEAHVTKCVTPRWATLANPAAPNASPARQVCSGSSQRTSASKRYGFSAARSAPHPAPQTLDRVRPVRQTETGRLNFPGSASSEGTRRRDDSALPFVPHLSPRPTATRRQSQRGRPGRLGRPTRSAVELFESARSRRDSALHERIGTLAKTRLGAVLWAGAGSYSGRPKRPATEPTSDRASCPTACCTGSCPLARRRTRPGSD
jgi:hypothetical protein